MKGRAVVTVLCGGEDRGGGGGPSCLRSEYQVEGGEHTELLDPLNV